MTKKFEKFWDDSNLKGLGQDKRLAEFIYNTAIDIAIELVIDILPDSVDFEGQTKIENAMSKLYVRQEDN